MRTESWQRVRKEEREGESESRVSKAVLAKFVRQTNQKVKRRSDAPHFSARIIRDGEMSHRGSTIMSDVFRKTVKIFNIMSEIPYLPVTG